MTDKDQADEGAKRAYTPRAGKIQRIGVVTPLLVPSFSSTLSNQAMRLEYQSGYLADSKLVSAFDLGRGHIRFEQLLGSTVVFIDSGGYEQRLAKTKATWLGAAEPVWSQADYQGVIERLPPGPRYVLCSYDYDVEMKAEKQLERAIKLQDANPDHAIDFLMKPERGWVCEPSTWEPHADKMARFDVVGVVEEELGSSPLERLRNIAAFRSMLDQNGIEAPFHVFGCLKPSLTVAYARAGAEVFDGLGWMRHAFDRGLTKHIDDYRLAQKDWDVPDTIYFQEVDGMNLRILRRMEAWLREWAANPHETMPHPEKPFGGILIEAISEIIRLAFPDKGDI